MREDYSPNGKAWEYLPHDHARSRAYRWNEDGLAGISDRRQMICFALALWNERDPILKERLFGLTANEGNHGEDVKECYFYLDSTPSHSYMKYLYKYTQAEFPYRSWWRKTVAATSTNRSSNCSIRVYSDEDRYFDVVVEYAKKPISRTFLIKINGHEPGAPEAAEVFACCPRFGSANTWSWGKP